MNILLRFKFFSAYFCMCVPEHWEKDERNGVCMFVT